MNTFYMLNPFIGKTTYICGDITDGEKIQLNDYRITKITPTKTKTLPIMKYIYIVDGIEMHNEAEPHLTESDKIYNYCANTPEYYKTLMDMIFAGAYYIHSKLYQNTDYTTWKEYITKAIEQNNQYSYYAAIDYGEYERDKNITEWIKAFDYVINSERDKELCFYAAHEIGKYYSRSENTLENLQLAKKYYKYAIKHKPNTTIANLLRRLETAIKLKINPDSVSFAPVCPTSIVAPSAPRARIVTLSSIANSSERQRATPPHKSVDELNKMTEKERKEYLIGHLNSFLGPGFKG